MIYITADLLTIGDKIIDGKHSIRVEKLDPCSTKGVRKVHVNRTLCYDTLPKLEVQPAHRPQENPLAEFLRLATEAGLSPHRIFDVDFEPYNPTSEFFPNQDAEPPF